MSWEGPSQWSQTTQATRNDTLEEHCKCPAQAPVYAPSATAIQCDHQIQTREGDAARWCTEQMPLTSFWGKSNWIWESITLPSARPGSPNLRILQGKTPFFTLSTSLLSRGGHTKEDILCGWPGCTGTSETSSPQMRDCSWWVLELSFHPASMRSILKASPRSPLRHKSPTECPPALVLARAGCRYCRLHQEVPGNAFASLSLPKIPCKLKMCHRSLGRG